ncbi:TLDc domain-containing protein [Zychaea mexicana]|uniref:TLDc domain-containing protein n=1 Tax=Zychaea mexicana TaxID=64656 RepID=UPI0022FE020D|nr:TLDc domain-containing protein [Zychaea mexicana]KAI9495775.1 TLDc domain-containing protein [Zychaea mexicana]
MPAPKLTDRRPDTVPVLTEDIADQVVAPQWTLLYSLDQHGVSLSTLYRRVRSNKGPCLLTIKDADDQVFGAFLNETLKSSPSYYGTGECFLWKKDPETGRCRVYAWTGKNEYMILAESDFIAIGGGEGKFGLWINSDLERGHSERCPTFENEALSITSEFDCIQLEVWGFRI